MRLEEIPVTTLKGIGVERAKDLSTMGIQTISFCIFPTGMKIIG